MVSEQSHPSSILAQRATSLSLRVRSDPRAQALSTHHGHASLHLHRLGLPTALPQPHHQFRLRGTVVTAPKCLWSPLLRHGGRQSGRDLFEWDIKAIRRLYDSSTQKSDLQLSTADEGLLDRLASCLDRLAPHMETENPGKVKQYLVWSTEKPKLQALQKETLEFTQRFGVKIDMTQMSLARIEDEQE